MESWTAGTLSTSRSAISRSSSARYPAMVVHGGERDERRRQVQARGPRDVNGAFEVLGGVTLRETLEDRIVDGFDRGDEEQASGLGESLDVPGVADDVFDLDGCVPGDFGERVMQSPRDPQRVGRAVEEVGVAERDVAGSSGHLLGRCLR